MSESVEIGGEGDGEDCGLHPIVEYRTACLPTFLLAPRAGGGLGRGIAASSAGDVSTARTQVPTGKMIKVYVRVIKVVINSMIKVYGKPLTYRGDGT